MTTGCHLLVQGYDVILGAAGWSTNMIKLEALLILSSRPSVQLGFELISSPAEFKKQRKLKLLRSGGNQASIFHGLKPGSLQVSTSTEKLVDSYPRGSAHVPSCIH